MPVLAGGFSAHFSQIAMLGDQLFACSPLWLRVGRLVLLVIPNVIGEVQVAIGMSATVEVLPDACWVRGPTDGAE